MRLTHHWKAIKSVSFSDQYVVPTTTVAILLDGLNPTTLGPFLFIGASTTGTWASGAITIVL
jgi:hypothetical protein